MNKSKSLQKPSIENTIENEMDVHRLGIRGLKWLKRNKDSFTIIQDELDYTRESITNTKDYKYRIKQYKYIHLLKKHAETIYNLLRNNFNSYVILGILSDLATKYHLNYAKKYVLFFKPISWEKKFKPVIKKNTFDQIIKFYRIRIKCDSINFSHNDLRLIAKDIESILDALSSDYHIFKY